MSAAPVTPSIRTNDRRPWVAIGDVHGHADLLATLLDAVEREVTDPRVVLLGDLIDRGPDAPGAIGLAREVPSRFPGSHVLLGNHEDWMLSAIDGHGGDAEDWLTWGGAQTCRAYGVDPSLDRDRLADAFAPHAADVEFLRARPRGVHGHGAASDFMFVHAGVDPTVPLDGQGARDLVWMREPFLSWPRALPRRIVHGHTIAREPQERIHRIGIDTGAYETGRLTAVILDGGPPRYLATHGGSVREIEPEREAAREPGAAPGRR